MDTARQLSEAFRIWKRSLKVKSYGFKKFPGDPWQICTQIVEACWTGQYYVTSLGHFRQFYARDFGICARALMGLKNASKVRHTLRFALDRFRFAKRITTHISPSGKVLDFPSYTPESLSYMLNSAIVAKDARLLSEFRAFFESEVRKAFESIDRDTGLVRSDRNFSTIKDQVRRVSPAYLNCMIGMLSDNLSGLDWENPFSDYDYRKIIKDNFWNGSYFVDDLSGKDFVSGDANTFAFWTGVFDDKNMLRKSVDAMKDAGLDDPIPLKYSRGRIQGMFPTNLLTPNYEGNTLWMHLGVAYLEVLERFKIKHDYFDRIKQMVSSFRTFPEVLNPDGTPYKSLFYYCDEGMLWSAVPLWLR